MPKITDKDKRNTFIEFSNLMISLKTPSSYARLFRSLERNQINLFENHYQDLDQIYIHLIKSIKDDPFLFTHGASVLDYTRGLICKYISIIRKNINKKETNYQKYFYDTTTKLLIYLFQSIIEIYSNDPNKMIQYPKHTETMEIYLIKFLEAAIEHNYFRHHYVELINLIKLTTQKILQTKKFSNDSMELELYAWKLYRVLKHLDTNNEIKNQTTILEQRAKTLNILLENINNLETYNTKQFLNLLYKAAVSDGFYIGLQKLKNEAEVLVSGQFKFK